jgi:maleamate amidohydrolase
MAEIARGWDQFLTKRDKQHLVASGWQKVEPFGLGDRPAVVVVDDYYSVLGTEREPLLESVQKWPLSCGLEGWAAIDRTVVLLAAARAASAPIVYLRTWEAFPGNWKPRKTESGLSPQELALGNEIVAELAPEPGDLVIEKIAASGFHHTPLASYFTKLGINTVIVCGETTSGCVRATTVDAAAHQYKVGVVEDCCFDRTEASHWMSLFDIHHKYADVMSLDETVDYFKAR